MNPQLIILIQTALSTIASLASQIAHTVSDFNTMSDTDKEALIARIKKIQASIPEWN